MNDGDSRVHPENEQELSQKTEPRAAGWSLAPAAKDCERDRDDKSK
jgi:hypothetical protein